VRVAFAGVQAPVHACYMAAWSLDALDAVGARASARLEPDAALTGSALRIELAGTDFRMSLERREDRLVTRVGDTSQCVSLPRPTEYMLMREELGIVRRDPVYDRTLASAARLAVSFPA
jgi:hypothetical protein